MENNLDLWGDVNSNGDSSKSILTLINNQAKLLELKTDGKVKADFCKVNYRHIDPNTTLKTVSSMASSILSPTTFKLRGINSSKRIEEIDDKKDLKNADAFFEQVKYKFEIYSDKYKYRLFILEYKSVFPISVEIEDGIIDENSISININSYQEMQDILEKVFTSKKVRFIIHEMKELSDS